MERSHYTNQQKLSILELVKNRSNYEVNNPGCQGCPTQIDDWKEKGEEMKSVSGSMKSIKFTLHNDSPMEYRELYQVLYQIVKELI